MSLEDDLLAAKSGMGGTHLQHGDAYVIGEIGSCHDGFFSEALGMIHCVGDSEYADGDAVKFQYFHSGQAVAAHRKAPQFAEMYEKYRLPADWLQALQKEAKAWGIDFICTTYLTEDIDTVAPYVDAFKIASFEAMNRKFIEAHLKYQKQIFISTGLLTHDELLRLIAIRAEVGYDKIKILHCVSTYPCPIDEIHLSVITRYGLDGFSDHTANPVMGALAYMAGARIFEAHVRSRNTSKENPDYAHALELGTSWVDYVANIRIAATALGTNLKQTQPSEAHYRQYMS